MSARPLERRQDRGEDPSDVGLIAGGLLLAGGAALVLFAPGENAEHPGVALRVSPLVGSGSGGVSLGGSF